MSIIQTLVKHLMSKRLGASAWERAPVSSIFGKILDSPGMQLYTHGLCFDHIRFLQR